MAGGKKTATAVENDTRVTLEDLCAFMNKHLLGTDPDLIDKKGRAALINAGRKPPFKDADIQKAGMAEMKQIHQDQIMRRVEMGEVNTDLEGEELADKITNLQG